MENPCAEAFFFSNGSSENNLYPNDNNHNNNQPKIDHWPEFFPPPPHGGLLPDPPFPPPFFPPFIPQQAAVWEAAQHQQTGFWNDPAAAPLEKNSPRDSPKLDDARNRKRNPSKTLEVGLENI